MNINMVTRKVDMLGRIVIPVDIRRRLNIEIGDKLDIYVGKNGICLKKQIKSDKVKETIEMLLDNMGCDESNSDEIKKKLNEALIILNKGV